MLTVLGALLAVVLPSAGILGAFSRRRGASRNAAGCCAVCGAPWSARYPDIDQYVVSGQLTCGECARRLRHRLHRGVFALGAVVAGVAVATLGSNGFDILVGNRPFAWWPLLYWAAPVATFATVGAIGARKLKADNRSALGAAS